MLLPRWLTAALFLFAGCDKNSPASSAEISRTNPAVSQQQTIPNNLAILTNSTSLGTPMYSYEIINVWPHDPSAFTQGLLYLNGALFESTGLRA